MTYLGIDYAWGGPPSTASMRGAGISFVGRYFSWDPSKNISAAEYAKLTRSGIAVVTTWETTATRARDGGPAGFADAVSAETQRKRCGMPDDQVIYFAIDFEASGPDVAPYFRSASATLGKRTGAYGGYDAVAHLFEEGLIEHAWQTYAWSGGRWHPRAMVRQYSNGHVFDSVGCDWDVMLTDPVHPKPVNPLDVLLEPERDAADSYLTYRRNPRQHPHGLKVAFDELVRFRKAIWVAAERGRLVNGQRTQLGWDHFERAERYRVLWGLTGHA
jgi:hypothetical protein